MQARSMAEEGLPRECASLATPKRLSRDPSMSSAGGSAATAPIRAVQSVPDPGALPMSPTCMQPQEMAAQVLFAEQEIGRLQVELQAAYKCEAKLRGELEAAKEELVRHCTAQAIKIVSSPILCHKLAVPVRNTVSIFAALP